MTSDVPIPRAAGEGDWRDMVSVGAGRIYRDGGFYDGEVPISRLEDATGSFGGCVTFIDELFPPQSIARPMPDFLEGPDPGFIERLLGHYRQIDGIFSAAAAAAVVRIHNAAIYDNVVFVVSDGALIPVYEMLRAADRAAKGREMAVRAGSAGSGWRLAYDGKALFVGSAGSSNYGHWLVDDFPTLGAVDCIDGNGLVTVLMSSYGGRIDAIRSEGAGLACPRSGTVAPVFLPTDHLVFVDDLHYVTPVSYHPIVKHPQALARIQALCAERWGSPSKAAERKLFVNRSSAHSRHITNNDAVRSVLLDHGFEEIFPEALSFQEQGQAFREASHVVGVMGAAMTNVLFCPPDSRVLQLAPSGWEESFYWDLAAMHGQSYNVLFGTAAGNSEHVHQCAFEVDIGRLRAWLEQAVPKLV
ncbi:uncharacterized protein DUF563 [Azospirillum brasilense]|nr:uncharacterized protein DUF563 [Azospirillum brasilense]